MPAGIISARRPKRSDSHPPKGAKISMQPPLTSPTEKALLADRCMVSMA